jgi:hypothetical protein
MLKTDSFVNDCAGIILDAVRSGSGRLQFVSEESKINRKFFTCNTFSTMRWFKLIRLLYCLSMKMEREEFCQLGRRLFLKIWLKADRCEYTLLDKRK